MNKEIFYQEFFECDDIYPKTIARFKKRKKRNIVGNFPATIVQEATTTSSAMPQRATEAPEESSNSFELTHFDSIARLFGTICKDGSGN